VQVIPPWLSREKGEERQKHIWAKKWNGDTATVINRKRSYSGKKAIRAAKGLRRGKVEGQKEKRKPERTSKSVPETKQPLKNWSING